MTNPDPDSPGTATKAPHVDVMARLSAGLDVIADRLRPGSGIIYLDYPVHGNVGDQLINLGTEAFFTRHRYEVIARLSINDLFTFHNRDGSFCKDKRLLGRLDALAQRGVPLVLHGGGNFGDLYPNFNEMRSRLLKRYAGHPVVLLPQSAHFQNARIQDETMALWSGHGNVFAFLRDNESLKLFQDASVPSALAPDLAHALWGDSRFSVAPGVPAETLQFMRRDDESAAGPGLARPRTFDWDDILSSKDRAFLLWFARVQKNGNSLTLSRWLQSAWYHYRGRLITRAVARLGRASRVNTDRLHGMILSCLMQRPVSYVDNSYGKLARYYRDWLAPSGAVGPWPGDCTGP